MVWKKSMFNTEYVLQLAQLKAFKRKLGKDCDEEFSHIIKTHGSGTLCKKWTRQYAMNKLCDLEDMSFMLLVDAWIY